MDVHFFRVADVGDQIAGCLDDFIADFVVGFEEHFDLSVVIFFANLALRTLCEIHSYQIVVCLEEIVNGVTD